MVRMEGELGGDMEEIKSIYDFVVTDAEILFMANSTGLFRSTDHGTNWADSYGDLFGGATMPTTCLSLQKETQQLFAGVPGGILISRDCGCTWEVTRLPDPAPLIVAIAFSPSFLVDQTLFAASAEDGLFCSHNGGASWDAWNFGLLDPNLFSLTVSPKLTQNRSLVVGSSTGIFRSANGGYSWFEMECPGIEEAVHSLMLVDSRDQNDILFVGLESSGLLLTEDNGMSWVKAGGLPVDEPVSRLVCFADLPGKIFCLMGSQLFHSDDFGQTFSLLDGFKTEVMCAQGKWLWLYAGEKVRRLAV